MVRLVDVQQRLDHIFGLIVESYIEDGNPVSSKHLCDKYRLPYSSATIRNVMELLEEAGLISHVHTSSGRVPTKKGFRYYVDILMRLQKEVHQAVPADEVNSIYERIGSLDDLLNRTSEVLASLTHYTSMTFLDDKIVMKGTHFMFDYPELLADIVSLRNLFTVFEEKLNDVKKVLNKCMESECTIFIGDEFGLEDVSDVSIVISGFKANRGTRGAVALMGPMRMNYARAMEELSTIKQKLTSKLAELL